MCRLYFSDEQVLELIDIPPEQYVLRGWSSDEQAVALKHGRSDHYIELIVLQNIKNVQISVSLHSPAQCSGPDAKAIVQIDYPVQIEFNDGNLTSTSFIRSGWFKLHRSLFIYVSYLLFYRYFIITTKS